MHGNKHREAAKMRSQRNMAQMKEQNKTPKNELNEIEISTLSGAQFKTLVTRKLQELTGYFKGIKKAQAVMKVTLIETKKNLQGTNSGGDEAQNQINDSEHKEEDFRPRWRHRRQTHCACLNNQKKENNKFKNKKQPELTEN